MKTFIRWAGSKKQILGKLKSHMPDNFNRYFEPFCGSGCLFFDIEPTKAILGDLNTELICTFQALQTDVQEVIKYLPKMRPGKENYYRIRSIDPKTLTKPEIAARFIYLNFYCFNGLYRTNLKGQFNVPFGRKKSNNPIDEDQIIACSNILKTAELHTGDFETTIKSAEQGDFVYLDPPFAISTRRMFFEYGPNTFCHKDLERLSKVLKRFNEKGVKFLISYADSPEARKLLSQWHSVRVRTRRNIAGFSGSRRVAYELLASNY